LEYGGRRRFVNGWKPTRSALPESGEDSRTSNPDAGEAQIVTELQSQQAST
jgi:hypothetical protein